MTGRASKPVRRPRCPKSSNKAGAWRAFYHRMALWLQSLADDLQAYPEAARMCSEDAKRYQEGVQMLDSGMHYNQLTGVWK